MGRRYSRTAAGGARIRGIPRVGSGGRPPGPAAWRGLSCRAPAGPGSGTGVPVRRVRAPGGGAPPEGPDRPAGSRAPRGVLQVESGLEAAIRHDPAGSGCPPPAGSRMCQQRRLITARPVCQNPRAHGIWPLCRVRQVQTCGKRRAAGTCQPILPPVCLVLWHTHADQQRGSRPGSMAPARTTWMSSRAGIVIICRFAIRFLIA